MTRQGGSVPKTCRFLKWMMEEYEAIKVGIDGLKAEVHEDKGNGQKTQKA